MILRPSDTCCAPPRPASPGARAAAQERHTQHPSFARRRAPGPASAPAGERDVTVCLRQRAGIPVHDGGLRPDDRTGSGCRGLRIEGDPHMLRHACGFALANKGSITSTAVYTALAPRGSCRLLERALMRPQRPRASRVRNRRGGMSSLLWARNVWLPLQGRDGQRRTRARAAVRLHG
jgi:hypothetical protein